MATNEVMQKLKDPFDPFDIEWRVQSAGETKQGKLWAILVPYITNRGIQDRLDEVCGVDGWYNQYQYPTERSVICGISIKFQGTRQDPNGANMLMGDKWITKWDGAEETAIEAVKGGLSSAMKRAAVQWGIGRYLYRLEAVIVTPLDKQPQDTSDYIMAQAKINNVKKRLWFKRPKLPAWALPRAKDE